MSFWEKQDAAVKALGKNATVRQCIAAGFFTEAEFRQAMKSQLSVGTTGQGQQSSSSSLMLSAILGYMLGSTS